MYLAAYDLFIPISVVVLAFLLMTAVPSKAEFRRLPCFEAERRIVRLPTMWLRGSLMLDFIDKWLTIASFGCSLLVVIMAMFDDPSYEVKSAIYATFSVLAAVSQWIVPFQKRSNAYRSVFNEFNLDVLEYRRKYLDCFCVDSSAQDRCLAFIKLEEKGVKLEKELAESFQNE